MRKDIDQFLKYELGEKVVNIKQPRRVYVITRDNEDGTYDIQSSVDKNKIIKSIEWYDLLKYIFIGKSKPGLEFLEEPRSVFDLTIEGVKNLLMDPECTLDIGLSDDITSFSVLEDCIRDMFKNVYMVRAKSVTVIDEDYPYDENNKKWVLTHVPADIGFILHFLLGKSPYNGYMVTEFHPGLINSMYQMKVMIKID